MDRPLHTLRDGILGMLTRGQSVINAIAILGFAGSLVFLAMSLAASLRPHLRGIID